MWAVVLPLAVLVCTQLECPFKGGVVPCQRAGRDAVLQATKSVVAAEHTACNRSHLLAALETIHSGEHRKFEMPRVLLDMLPVQPLRKELCIFA